MRRTNPSRSSPHFVLVSSLGLGDRLWQNSLSVLAAFANKHLIKQEDYCPIATLSIKLISKLRGWQRGGGGGGGGGGYQSRIKLNFSEMKSRITENSFN